MMYSLMVPIMFLLLYYRGARLGTLVARTFFWGGVALAAFGVASYFFFDRSMLWGGLRVYSLMGNPNTFGLFLLIPGMIAWAMFLQRRGLRSRLAFVGIVAILAVALVLSMSFQALVSFVLALVAVSLMIRGVRAIWAVSGVTLICLVGYLLVAAHFQPLIDALYFKLQSPESTSYLGRVDQLYYVAGVLQHPANWLIGVPDQTSYATFDSQYWNLIINNGIFAGLLYILPPVYVGYLGWRVRHSVLSQNSHWYAALYVTAVSFLTIVTLVTANLTAFMQRFPINFYYYVLMAFVLYTVWQHTAAEPSRRAEEGRRRLALVLGSGAARRADIDSVEAGS
jgi:hypothetical protein